MAQQPSSAAEQAASAGASGGTSLSGVGLDVRRQDRERFVTALFCPASVREDVLAAVGFNAELGRIRALIREPLAGSIRLQWWRDLLEGARPGDEIARHPIAQPLTRMIADDRLDKADLLGMVDARERDVEGLGFESMADLSAYAWATSGALAGTVARISGVEDASSLQAAREAASAYALVGMVRSLRFHLATGWMTLPHDALKRAGLAPDDVSDGMKGQDRLVPVVREIAEHAAGMLERARSRRVTAAAIPACLTGTLAAGHLKTLRKVGCDPFAPALALPRTMPLRLLLNAMLRRF